MDAEMQTMMKVQQELTRARLDDWVEKLFSPGWWFLLFLFIISTIIWWKTANKAKLPEIILHASIIIIMTLALDQLGEELSLWYYPVDVTPLFPPLSAVDLSSLPMVYSIIYQRFSKWKGFLIASILMSSIFCFILEPLFVWIGVYQPIIWKSYYGFPIYIAMGIIAKAAADKVRSVAAKSGGGPTVRKSGRAAWK